MNNGMLNITNNYIQSIFKNGNSIPKSIHTPGNINNSINWKTVGPQFWSRWQEIISNLIGNISYDYKPYSVRTVFPGGANPYLGAVMMEDGRLFFVPFSATVGQIYDPINDRIITPTGNYEGGNASSGAVLIHTGEVLLVPRSKSCKVYNPYSNSMRTIGSAPAVADAFYSGVVMADGRVFCVSGFSTFCQIIDPKLNTITAVPGTVNSGNISGVLLPDGRILSIAGAHPNTSYIYDPVSNTYKTASITANSGLNTTAYFGGVLLPDGNVFIIPQAATAALIYDYRTDKARVVPGTISGYNNGILLPDGGVFLISGTANTPHRIYYYNTNTYVVLSTAPTVNSEFASCYVLQDGRIFMCPRNGTTGRGYGNKTSVTFPVDVMLSAYYSKR